MFLSGVVSLVSVPLRRAERRLGNVAGGTSSQRLVAGDLLYSDACLAREDTLLGCEDTVAEDTFLSNVLREAVKLRGVLLAFMLRTTVLLRELLQKGEEESPRCGGRRATLGNGVLRPPGR